MTGKNKWKTREFRAASQNIKESFLKFMFIDENIFSFCCTIHVKSEIIFGSIWSTGALPFLTLLWNLTLKQSSFGPFVSFYHNKKEPEVLHLGKTGPNANVNGHKKLKFLVHICLAISCSDSRLV